MVHHSYRPAISLSPLRNIVSGAGWLLLLCGLVDRGAAQTALTPARRLVPLQQPAATLQPATAIQGDEGEATTTTAQVVSEPVDQEQQLKDQRLAQLRAVVCDRRPSTILAAWSQPPETKGTQESATEEETSDTPPAEPDPVQESLQRLAEELELFSRAVTLGDWDHVGRYLKDSLSAEEAQVLYDHLLQSLARTPESVPADLPPEVQQQLRQFKQMQAQQQRGQPELNEVNWIVVMALAGLAPAELSEAQLNSLGQLGALAIRQGHAVQDWVQRLQVASQATGEQPAPVTRRQAALMLTAAGQAVEAGGFLDDVQTLRDEQDLQGLNLLAQHLLARYRADNDRNLLKEAWLTTQAVLAASSDQDVQTEKEKALQQAVDLAPQVEESLGQAWLDESFRGDAQRGKDILASIGSGAAKGLETSANNTNARLKLLELQQTAVSALLKSSPELASQWGEVLSVLATHWLREANIAYQYDTSTSFGPQMQRDPYGNIYYLDSRSMGGNVIPGRGMSAIATAELLELRPGSDWIQFVEPSLQPEFQKATAQLFLKVQQEDEALPYIEQLAGEYPALAQELVDEFLRVWTRNHDPNSAQNRTSSYLYVYGFQQRAQAIPLTRSKQQRNLEELAELVKRLRDLPVELDETLMQRAFTTCHSSAEVYQLEAIEKVFGQLEAIDPKTLASLIQGMRANLGGLWRQPATQETAQTKRRKKDIEAEVVRGYATARSVVAEALTRFPSDWALLLARAAVAHDENNYQREIAPNSQFVEKQQESFAEFAAAAHHYVEQVGTLREDEYSVEPFELWFYASLGACDLGQIDTDKRPDLAQPPLIRQAIESMPAAIAEKHLAMFANDLFTRMSAVSPGVKFRYLESGFLIAGDHEQAREARQVFDYYRDLVTEIELRTEIDGNTTVGHTHPFGVFVNLRHTVEIERESGGFARYLQNQNTGTTYYYNYGRPLENYRDKFEEFVRDALSEHFEVLSVTFQSEDVNSRATAVDGWRITPYAYVLLKARGPEVDKLPAVRLDLDFMDTSGYVVLPIESPLLPLDASQEPTEPRPVAEISLTQTLDERQAGEGKLILEIQATANGLVPELEQLVTPEFPGFEVVSTDDQGVSVSRFDPESEENSVISERTWLVTMEASESSAEMPKEYTFAEPIIGVSEVTYQRYEDADLVTVPTTIRLEQTYGKRSYAWLLWLVGLPIVAVVALGVGWLLRPQRPVVAEVSSLKMPAQLTPFSVLALLDEIQRRGQFNPQVSGELEGARLAVERAYFGDINGEPKPDLEKVARQWVDQYARG